MRKPTRQSLGFICCCSRLSSLLNRTSTWYCYTGTCWLIQPRASSLLGCWTSILGWRRPVVCWRTQRAYVSEGLSPVPMKLARRIKAGEFVDFRVYLYGHVCDVCDVYTDHEALQTLLNTPHPSGKLACRGLALQELNLWIHYRPGRKNQNADALSRVPIDSQLEK